MNVKMKLLGMVLLVMMLTSCWADDVARVVPRVAQSGAGSVDDFTRVGQVVVKNYGDELLANSRRLTGSSALQSSDEYALRVASDLDSLLANRPAGQSLDDIALDLKPYSESILSRSSAAAKPFAPLPIYLAPRTQWTATQVGVLEEIRSRLAMSGDEAELFLESACKIMDYAKLYDKFPTKDYSDFTVLFLIAQNELQPPQQGYAEFAASVVDFAAALIAEQDGVTFESASEIAFDGLCLIP